MAAFAAVYVIWGSTYLAIRVAVETLPPFLMAGVRFVTAGSMLYVWARWRGAAAPERGHWRSAAVVGGLLLVGGNGGVVWAEQWVPSGVAALLVTTVPLWMVLLNWVRPGGVRPRRVEVVGLALGFVGVVFLVDPGSLGGGDRLQYVGMAVLVMAALSWAIGSLYSRHALLPKSPLLSTAMQMLAGGGMLLVLGAVTGEGASFDPGRVAARSVLALAYLIVFGALVGFTAYCWLLRVSTPAKVSTYAYVNPAIAVLLGWAILSEPVTAKTFMAMAVILTGVILITTRATKGAPPPGIDGEAPRPPQRSESASGRIEANVHAPCTGDRHTLDELRVERELLDRPYLEFLRKESLSVGIYVLPIGGADSQQPHTEDEVYYVVVGKARLMVGGDDQPVGPGSIVFVDAGVPHRFHAIEEELTVLVFFAPPEMARRTATETLAETTQGESE